MVRDFDLGVDADHEHAWLLKDLSEAARIARSADSSITRTEVLEAVADVYVALVEGGHIGAGALLPAGDGKAVAYLVAALKNRRVDAIRKRSRYLKRHRQADPEHSEPEALDAGVPSRVAAREALRRVSEFVDALPQKLSQIFQLHAVRSLAFTEIAGLLGIPESTARNRWFRLSALVKNDPAFAEHVRS